MRGFMVPSTGSTPGCTQKGMPLHHANMLSEVSVPEDNAMHENKSFLDLLSMDRLRVETP